jgi:hypothetical protein
MWISLRAWEAQAPLAGAWGRPRADILSVRDHNGPEGRNDHDVDRADAPGGV